MSVTVVDLAAEHRGAGPFVATSTPRLSWRVATTTPDWYQASYEVEVAGDLAHRSGPIASGDSVLVPWPVAPLASRQRVACRSPRATPCWCRGRRRRWHRASAWRAASGSPAPTG